LNFFLAGLLVDYPDDNTRFLYGLIGAFDTYLLYLVSGLAYAGSVDETEGDALDINRILNGVAGGAVNVGNDGTVFVEQTVEQGRFPYVGLANDGNRDTLFDGFSCLKGTNEFFEMIVNNFRKFV
jgi:hypothetical protein